MTSLLWSQVLAWRLSQQHLLQRAPCAQLLQVVSRLVGVQAQLMPAAELALWARLEGVSQVDISNALWQERSLLKTWAMRGTLHLLVASELPLLVAARSAVDIHRPPSYYRYHGLTSEEAQAILDHLPAALSETPVTREQLAEAVAAQAGMPNLRQVLLSGWGALLKPSAFRGEIGFGPNQGQNVTFVRPDLWVPSSASVGRQPVERHSDSQAAFKEIARRYLAVYGPAAPEDFARWWGTDAGPAKKLFRSLGDEIVEVDIEGHKAWALAGTFQTIQALPAEATHPACVRLLPMFDAYTVATPRDTTAVLPAGHKSRVYRPQGWISAVVLVNGQMRGVWEYELQRGRLVVRVELFSPPVSPKPPSSEVQAGIQAEARRLGVFLGAEVDVEIRG